ncbi:MAG: methyltransferase family protein [Minisyncoccota bacterium]
MSRLTETSDSPGVIVPPPFVYMGGLVAGVVLQWLKPVVVLPKKLTVPLGVTLVIISVALVVAAMRAFIKAKTNIDVRKPTTSIVESGPYRFSRNPIYLSMTLLVLGIAAWVNTLWILIMLVPILVVMQLGVIAREEAYLTKKFGEKYLQYKSKVRRWL